MKILVTESQYLKLINESEVEEYKNLTKEQWDKVWLDLRKFNDYKTLIYLKMDFMFLVGYFSF